MSQQLAAASVNLNIHFHMLLLDGVYLCGHDRRDHPRFRTVKAPDKAELQPRSQIPVYSNISNN